MKTGFFVGVPLTLMQLCVHTQVPPSTLVACNFLLGHSIYDADRMTSPRFDPERTSTRLAMLASAAILASHQGSAKISPLVPALHFGYTPLKPALAPVKPFFVASAWTILVYYVPLLYGGTDLPPDVATPATIFLLLSTLSHSLDILDIDEDVSEGVTTPAVFLSEGGERIEEAKHYAIALSLATCVVYTHSPQYSELLELLFFSCTASIVSESTFVGGVLSMLTVLFYVRTHEFEILGKMLESTEVSHKIAIEKIIEMSELIKVTPQPWRNVLIELTTSAVNFGDEMGSHMIHMFLNALKNSV